MIRLLVVIFLLSSFISTSQNTCDSNGNLAIFSNYDGGILTINVDQNIPNLKVGICTYEPIQVSFTGPFVGNVTQVIYAGFNSTQNNNNCNLGNFPSSVTGVAANLVTIETAPPVGYTPAHGNGAGPWGGIMIGASGQCDTINSAGGGNTPDEIVFYFQQQTGGSLLFHKTQYNCWVNETLNISDGGSCCILPPENCGLSATTSVIPNSVCQPCNYNGPSILINEINIFPSNGDGSIFGASPTGQGKGEWIELFNPNWCDSVDISGYILGSYNSTLSSNPSTSNGMAFVLPPGTIVPPLGFVIVRGQNAFPPGGAAIDVVVSNSNNEACIQGGINTSRIWFQNSGSWFAFYDAQGIPQDAIRWGTPTNSDLNQSPCIPPTNSLPIGTTTLPSFNQISAMGLTATLGASSQGFTYRRMPDGGAWSNTLASEYSSYATCNDPTNCDVFSGVSQCNGSATVNITTGVAPYTFQWDDPLNQITQTAVNLCEGTYNVLVTDANACSETYQVNVISNPFSINADVIQPGCLQSNGAISLNPNNSNYTYSWSPNVSITNSASNLSQGSYTITVSEGSCSFDTTIILQNPTPFTATLVTENTSCGENNGVINVDINPPGNYNLTWTPSVSTTQTASSLSPGNYSINISDNVCETTLTATIGSSVPITANVQVQNTSCNDANGAIWIDLSPPSNYSYSWTPNVSIADSAMNLLSGNYQIQYTDGECNGDTTLILAPSDAPNEILYAVTPTNCGTNNGSISITQVVGGQSPYLYSFNSQQIFGSTSDTISLSNQNYDIAVIDANGCVYVESVVVSEIPGPNEIVNSKVNPTCGTNNGSIFIQGTVGGVSPYIYEFNGQIINDTAILNLSAGTYTVEVKDIFGCSFQQSINLMNAAGIASVFIPNVFTPNQDNLNTNEYWKVGATCIQSVTGTILNRWGDIVFDFDELSDSWDGRTKSGEAVNDGVYFYNIEVSYFDDTSEIFHGHITVIR